MPCIGPATSMRRGSGHVWIEPAALAASSWPGPSRHCSPDALPPARRAWSGTPSSAAASPSRRCRCRSSTGWGRVVAHADLGWSRWKVALEYEGRQHAEREQFGRDIDRYSLMAADGWLVVRFAGRHLGRLDTVVARAAGALRSRGARW